MTRSLVTSVLVLPALLGCRPEFDDDLALIDRPRILAVQSVPAQSKPEDRADITWRALVVDRNGRFSDGAPLDWALCLARKPLTELGPVSPACLVASSPDLVPIETGANRLVVTGKLPEKACSLFGPQRPEPEPGEPSGRPADPDPTGGFYQTLRLLLRLGADEYALGQTRLDCSLSGLSQPQSIEYNRRHRQNQNPSIARVFANRAGGSTELLLAEPLLVAAGEQLVFEAEWPPCPEAEVCGDGFCGIDETRDTCPEECTSIGSGCAGAERYVAFDQETRAISVRRESMTMSWYANGGRFANERTGRSEVELLTSSPNTWTAPASGSVTLWIVIRDSRGGVGLGEYAIRVAE